MSWAADGALYLAAMLLQWWWSSRWPLAGAAPQLLLALTLLCAARRGPVAGMLAGFGWGLFLDVWRAELFGASALTLVLAGYAAGMLRRQVDLRSPTALAAAAALAAWGGLLLQGMLGLVFARAFERFPWSVWLLTPPMTAAAAALAAAWPRPEARR